MNSSTIKTGVMILRKTFGMKKNRHLYKCITEGTKKTIVVPYQIDLGFSKKLTNKYVVFEYLTTNATTADATTANATTPTTEIVVATLKHVFGDVDDPVAWNEYQLYYRGLHTKMSLSKTIPETHNPKNIIDRSSEFAFTVDNENTEDFDDAFSICLETNCTRLSIYIADVASRFSAAEIGEMISSKGATHRPASIYLSHRRVPLFPTAWAREFSLNSGSPRRAVALDVFIDSTSGAIVRVEWAQRVTICVKKHYRYHDVYDDHPHLAEFMSISRSQGSPTSLKSAVAHWMEFYCAEAGRRLWPTRSGIFMRLRGRRTHFSLVANKEEAREAKYYMNDANDANDANNINNNYSDYSLKEDGEKRYAQVTSPIRRWMDIYNQHCLLSNDEGLNDIVISLERINEQMRQIRKLQMDSALMARFPEISASSKTFAATLMDVFEKNGEHKKYKYTVFLEELNLVSRLTTMEPLDESQPSHAVRIFIFKDEHSLKKKMRLVVCDLAIQNRNIM
jgi:hypothetical protein